MSALYISENGVVLGIDGNRLSIKYKDGLLRTVPIETIEEITLLGKNQLTTQCMEVCMSKGIPVSFFNKGGRYFGRLMSTGHVKAKLQRVQAELYDTEFALGLSKRIISAKINNQVVVLKRYSKKDAVDIDDIVFNMQVSKRKVIECDTIEEIIGYEGNAAKNYFAGLSKCIDADFAFNGRSRRPPKDEFNSLISLGYSILMNEIYSEIENHGLNPYFGFLHRDSEKHPTLCSDLLEEWRAVLIDSLALSMINGHELSKNDFEINVVEPGCFLTKECLKKYISKLDEKLKVKMQYLRQVDYPVNFRSAIGLQISELSKAIEAGDYTIYKPVTIR